MKVKIKEMRYGCLIGEDNRRYFGVDDGEGNIISEDDGDLYKVSRRDENDNIVEIENL